MDCSLPGSSVHGIFQARILEWVAISFSKTLFPGFLRPEYWSGYPFPSPGDISNPRIEPRSPTLQTDSLPAEPQGKSKNTGVGILSLLQGIYLTQKLDQGLLHCRWILYQVSYWGSPKVPWSEVKWSESHSIASNPLRPHELYSPWNSPGQNTGVGSFSLLQGIFPTQGLNPGLPHCRQILYQLSYQGSPKYHRASLKIHRNLITTAGILFHCQHPNLTSLFC